jgi:hypothetical protein
MPITAAFGEIPKFAEDHVFWGGNADVKHFLSMSKFDPSTSWFAINATAPRNNLTGGRK